MQVTKKITPRAGERRGESIREDSRNHITVEVDAQYMKSLENVREARRRFDMGTGTEAELRRAMEEGAVAVCSDVPPSIMRQALRQMGMESGRKPGCV